MGSMSTAFLSTFIKEICPLPKGIEFFSIDGKIVFPIRSVSGGLTDDLIVYLVKRGKGTNYKYGISLKELFKRPVEDFLEKLKNADGSKVLQFDPNGGDLGTGDNKKTTVEEVKKLDHPLE